MVHACNITLICLLFGIKSFAQDDKTVKNNAYINTYANYVRCSNGNGIYIQQLLGARGITNPNFSYNASIPFTCTDKVKEQINNMIEQFKKEDQSNIQGLANSYCSHQAGWTEIVPGTCSAGGPPPICEAEHWKQVSRAESMKEYEKQNMIKAKERAMKLAKLNDNICACTVNELRRQDRVRSESFNQSLSELSREKGNLENEVKSSIKITCMGGCLPGYDCKDGYCEPDGATVERRVLDKVVGKVYEKGKEEILKKLLENMGVLGNKFLGGLAFVEKYNIYTTGVSAFFDGPPNVKIGSNDGSGQTHFITGKMSGGNELYITSLSKVSASVLNP